MQALLHQARGDEPAALATLAEAIELAQPGRFLRLFVDLGPQLVRLLVRLELDEEGSRYVGQILATFPDDEAAEEPAAEEPGSTRFASSNRVGSSLPLSPPSLCRIR